MTRPACCATPPLGRKRSGLRSAVATSLAQIDLASDATASKSTRGPAGKGFDKSLGVSASDLEALCKELLDQELAAGKGAP